MKRAIVGIVLLSGCDPQAASDPVAFRLHGADAAQECQWPAVGVLDDARPDPCTSVLVHPSVLLTTAGCIQSLLPDGQHRVWLGEVASSPRASATVEQCTPHPDAIGSADNLAVCTLVEPMEDLPIAPVLHPSDSAQLEIGATLAVVGFGAERLPYDGEFFLMPTGMGRKRVGTHEITAFDEADNTMTLWSTDESRTCYGDWGGPAMLELPDGSWRVAGIVSFVNVPGIASENACTPELTPFARLSNRIEWIEEVTGVDVTPCHDDDGKPVETEACEAVPHHIGEPGATWDDACAAPAGGDESGETGSAETTGDSGPEPPEPSTTSMTTGSAEPPPPTASSGEGETGDAPASAPESGCGCYSGERPPLPVLVLLALLGPATLRRRHP